MRNRPSFALWSPLGWKEGEGLLQSASATAIAFVSHLCVWRINSTAPSVLLPPVPLQPSVVKEFSPYTVPFSMKQIAVNLTFAKCVLVTVSTRMKQYKSTGSGLTFMNR